MKYLSIDYGLARTGIAVSDDGGSMAFPRTTIAMRGKDAYFSELFEIMETEGASAIVVGLPLYADGTDSEITRQVRNMVARLKRRTDLPVYFMPETLSSYDAETRLRQAGLKGKELKAALDQASAVTILESFLALPPAKRVLA